MPSRTSTSEASFKSSLRIAPTVWATSPSRIRKIGFFCLMVRGRLAGRAATDVTLDAQIVDRSDSGALTVQATTVTNQYAYVSGKQGALLAVGVNSDSATSNNSTNAGLGSNVTVTMKYWDYPNYSGSGTTGSGVQCDAIEVRVAYTHRFAVPFFQLIAPSGVSIAGSQRMVNEPFGPCS